MCQPIPVWARQTTIWSGLIYLWTCGGFYYDFLESFLEGQLCPLICASNGDAWLCQSRWHLSVPILIMIYVVCSPAELSGGLSRCINFTNTIVKAIVIMGVIAKGVLTWSSNTDLSRASSHMAWNPLGFFRVSSILMGSLANSGIMPQLAADVQPNIRKQATVWCPIVAVSLQSSIFLLVGLSGYAALGSSVELDIIRVYQEECPDFLTSILQGGFALMTYLGFPLVIIPCKSQIWSFWVPRPNASASMVPLSTASYPIQVALTWFFALPCVLVPLILGEQKFGHFMLVLSCTAGVWMNLLLPAVVLLYSQILPNRRARGTVDRASLLTVGWILALGTLCLVDGVMQMLEPQKAAKASNMSQQCREAFYHRNMTKVPAVHTDLSSV